MMLEKPAQPSETPETTTPEWMAPQTSVEELSSDSDVPVTKIKNSSFKPSKKVLWVGGVLGVLLLAVGVMGIVTFSVLSALKTQASTAQATAREAYTQFKAQNLPASQTALSQLDQQLADITTTYKKLSWYKFIPIARSYYLDGEHGLAAADSGLSAGLTAINAITPYADVLGFSGEGTFEGGTAENRIKLMLDTLTKVTPQLDAIGADLAKTQSELDQIDARRYPESIRGIAVRSRIDEGKNLVAGASKALTDYRPIIEKLPEIAGSAEGGRKKYLVLFQNDNELRPTGGFLTAYAVIFIENGVVTPEKSDDIYEIDKKFSKKLPIPPALGKYLITEKYWNLRDMNTSPDFKISMQQFFDNYKTVRGEPANIDGIIAVDTHMLTDLVKVVGPVQIAGYGTFSADNDPSCDCPQIIHALSEIITRPTPYLRQDRKGILAPLMQSILQKIYASPRVFMSQLFTVGLDAVEGRHMQAYLFNPEHQQAVEAINAAGRMIDDPQAEDFLGIVNANLGGAKSNLFIDYDVTQKVSAPENGMITKEVKITYKNNRKGDNCNLEAGLLCLNSTLRDWTRIYLPKGSVLTEAQGFVSAPGVYEEEGFQVIDGFFTLEPLAQASLVLKYTVPYTNQTEYTLQMWKQGGISPVPVLMDVTGGEEQFTLSKDTIFKTKF